jgi:hypothetical protein
MDALACLWLLSRTLLEALMISIVRSSILALATVTLLGVSTTADAATIDVVAATDGYVVLVNGQPINVATGQNTNLSQSVIPGQDVRSIYEFDLPELTEPIVSASFLGSAVLNSAAPGTLTFFGYPGNGTIDLSDATQVNTQVGSVVIPSQIPNGTSLSLDVPLPAAFLTSLGSGFLGLTTTVGTGDTILVASLESEVGIRPTLRIVTQDQDTPGGETGDTTGEPSVPEPASMLLLLGGIAGVAGRSRKSRTARD